MENRDTCIFYRSIYESLQELDLENQAIIYNAIFEYSLNFNEPDLTGINKAFFGLIRPVLEKGNTNFINGSKAKRKRNRSELEAKPKRIVNEVQAYKDKDKDKDENKNKDIINAAKASSFKSFTNQDLINQMKPLIEKYGKDTCNAFYSYWSEPLANGKMRMTGEKAWDTNRRLSTWKQREKQPNTNFVKQAPAVFNRSSQGQKYVGNDVI